jgi:hypothetical protein
MVIKILSVVLEWAVVEASDAADNGNRELAQACADLVNAITKVANLLRKK